MKLSPIYNHLLIGFIAFSAFYAIPTAAQVIPDTTLSNNSIAPPNCTNCEITGGTQVGRNLFHSFEQFSVPTEGRAFFNNAANVQNIFTRITGRLPSTIDGILQTNSTANLFLLNPNGIIFGRNSSLNLGGSFFATTAERIDFADGIQFSVISSQTSPLLTISTPVGLQFGRTLGTIINRSRSTLNNSLNTLNAPVGLQVPTGQTLALISNGIFLEGGNLTARSGQVELGSVAAQGRVDLLPIATRYDLTYPNVQNFLDIQILAGSYIDTSGEFDSPQGHGGAIQAQGRNILLTEEASIVSSSFRGIGENVQFIASGSMRINSGSVIATFAEESGSAGNLVIRVDDSIELRNARTALSAQARRNSTGDAGNISVDTGNLSLLQGATIRASTFGTGRSGDIRVRATAIEIIGSNSTGTLSSGIFSQIAPNSGTPGRTSGNLTINTRRLTLQNGGLISTATSGKGNSGELSINATEFITMSGTTVAVTRNQNRSGIFTSAEPGATGSVGRLQITTDRLTVADRAEISANNRGTGDPGIARLNVDRLILQNGGEIRAGSPMLPVGNMPNPDQGDGGRLIINANRIQLMGAGTIEAETFPSAIAAYSESAGNAGDLEITTSSLDILNGAEVSVSGRNTGAAGDLFVSADRITLDRGTLSASTQAIQGGNIFLEDVNLLTLNNNSILSARAANQARGGNVSVSAPNGFVIATGANNDIIADAVEGQGGNITLQAQSIIGFAEQVSNPANFTNDIDASSEFGAPGSVTINQINPDPSQGAIELPTDIIDASSLVAQTCSARGAIARTPGEFIITGRGGLSPSPTAPLGSASTLPHWIALNDSARSIPLNRQEPQRSAASHSEVLEAQGWVKTADGTVTLIAESPAVAQASVDQLRINCDRRQ
jgi:filamentous hemagglutinin family protein